VGGWPEDRSVPRRVVEPKPHDAYRQSARAGRDPARGELIPTPVASHTTTATNRLAASESACVAVSLLGVLVVVLAV
jgi:hypothetical protein